MSVNSIKAWLLQHEYLIWILCVCALLRLPSLIEPYWYGDEGIYLTLGHAIRQGLHLYRDIHDNKPPLIYLMAAVTGSVFWFRFFLLIWNSIAIVVFERLARHLFGETGHDSARTILGISFPIPRWSTLATLLFAVVPFFAEGAIANGEIFMIMPVIAGMLLLWQRSIGHRPQATGYRTIFAGLFFSFAFLIKVPALFDAAAAGFFFFIVIRDWKKPLASFLLPLVSFSLAFLLPIILSVIYYSAYGVGKQYIAAAFAQNVGYLSSWTTGSHEASSEGTSGLRNRAVIVLIATVITSVLARKNGKVLTFLLLWAGFALFGALLSERPYPHYLIQVIPPVALLVTYFFKIVVDTGLPTYNRRTINSVFLKIACIGVSLAVLAYAIVTIRFWYYPLMPYYKNYVEFVLGTKSRDAYLSHFDPRLPKLYSVSNYIQSTTTASERIFVWGDAPMIYALSRRLPPGRYTSNYHIFDFNGTDETIRAIEQARPRYIVVDTTYTRRLPELEAILQTTYLPTYEGMPYILYKRIGL